MKISLKESKNYYSIQEILIWVYNPDTTLSLWTHKVFPERNNVSSLPDENFINVAYKLLELWANEDKRKIMKKFIIILKKFDLKGT